MTITIELPWPNSKLSPNARIHWRPKAVIEQMAHRTGLVVAREVVGPEPPPLEGHLPVTMIFCPPDRRGRDLDNLGASMKWALDGVADALRVNDKNFRPITKDWGDVCKPGKVIVKIGA